MDRIGTFLRASIVLAILWGLVVPLVPPAAAQEAESSPPRAGDASVATHHGVPVVVDVLALASDPDPGDTLTLEAFTQVAHGAVAVNDERSLAYRPAAGYVGLDSFTYTVTDQTGLTAGGTVTVEVTDVAPTAGPGLAQTHQGTDLLIDVLGLAADQDGDPLSLVEWSQGTSGQVLDNGDGRLVYRPNAGFAGNDAFDYIVSDGALTAGNTVTIEVANGAPVAIERAVTTHHGTAVTIELAAAVSDPDGDALALTSIVQGANGTVVDGGNGTLVYTPVPGFVGEDRFLFTVSDGVDQVSATVSVTVANQAPEVPAGTLTAEAGVPVTIDLLALATDPDGDALTLASVTDGALGTVTNNGDGTVTYVAADGSSGADEFAFTVSDGAAEISGSVAVQIGEGAAAGTEVGSALIAEGDGLNTEPPIESPDFASLAVTKLGSDAGQTPIPGACFQLYLDANGDGVFNPSEDSGGLFGGEGDASSGTDGDVLYGDSCDDWDDGGEDGVTHFAELAGGSYFIVETQAPLGYLLAEPQSITIIAGASASISVVDEPHGTVTRDVTVLVTTYADAAEPTVLLDSCAAVYTTGGEPVTLNESTLYERCDWDDDVRDGVIPLGLAPGDYTLIVSVSIAWYPDRPQILAVPITVTSPPPTMIDVYVPAGGTLTVTKLGSDTGSTPLVNACFDLFLDTNGNGAFDPSPTYDAPWWSPSQDVDSHWGGMCDGWNTGGQYILDGVVAFNNLPPGVYFLVETVVPFGYAVAPPQQVVVEPGTNAVAVVDVPGGVVVSTLGSDTGGVPLTDLTCYSIHAGIGGATGEQVSFGCTSHWGHPGQFHDPLPPGDYVLVPTGAPAGYGSIDPIPFSVAAGARTMVDAVFPRPMGSLTVTKLGSDTGATPLPWACFDLHLDANGNGAYDSPSTDPRAAGACDADGAVDGITDFGQIPAGAYFVVESSSPNGYLPAAPQPVTVQPDGTHAIEIVDEPGGLVVTTYGADTGTSPLPGAIYGIYTDNGKGGLGTLVTIRSDWQDGAEDGIVGYPLAPGHYVLAMTVAPSGYQPSLHVSLSVEVGAATKRTITLTPEVTGPVVTVYGSDTRPSTLPGACFDIWRDGAWAVLAPWVIEHACDGDDGRLDGIVRFPIIEAGAYRLAQSGDVSGYVHAADVPFTVQSDVTARVEVELVPARAALAVTARLADSGELLHDACFELFRDTNDNGTYDEGSDHAFSYRCDRDDSLFGLTTDGITRFDNLFADTYFVVQRGLPAGYVAAAPASVTLGRGESKAITVTAAPGGLVLTAYRADAPTSPLGGACFSAFVVYESGSRGGMSGGGCTASDGVLAMPLRPGSYVLVHTSSPDGYGFVPETPFSVESGRPTRLSLMLPHPASLTVRTLGSDSGDAALPGACYRLYADRDADGRPDTDGWTDRVCDKDDSLFGAFDDGLTVFPRVAPDSYLLKQEAAPDGYVLVSALRPVTLLPGESGRIDVVNEPLQATLTITASGDDKGAAILTGACFALHRDADDDGVYDPPVSFGAAGDPQVTWACDDGSLGWFGGDGVTRLEGILPGDYFLVETQAPAGYAPAAPMPLTFAAGEQKALTISHTRPASLIVTTIRLRIGDIRQVLPGACYDLHRDSGALGAFDPAIDVKVAWACDDGAVGLFGGDGITELRNLTAGAYFLIQTQAPSHEGVEYALAPPQAVVVAPGESKQVDVRNRYLHRVVIETRGSDTGSYLLRGACYALHRDVDGNGSYGAVTDVEVTSACDGFLLDVDGITTVSGVPEGRYFVRLSAPVYGYRQPEPLAIELENDVDTGTIVIVLRPDGPVVTTYGSDTRGGALPGACYEIRNGAGAVLASACDGQDGRDDGLTRFPGLDAGGYQLFSTSVPAHYLPAHDGSFPTGSRSFSVAPDVDTLLYVTLERRPRLTVLTAEAGTGIRLSGGCFDLYKDQDADGALDAGEPMVGWSCHLGDAATGGATFDDLDAGAYLVVQTGAPSDHLPASDPIPVATVPGQNLAITVENEATGLLIWVKGDNTGDLTAHAWRVAQNPLFSYDVVPVCFEVWKEGWALPVASRCDADDDFDLLGTSYNDGYVRLPGLAPGTYRLVQTSGYDQPGEIYRYLLASEMTFSVEEGPATRLSVVMPRPAHAVITKRGSDRGDLSLPGACFDLRADADDDGVYAPAADPVRASACDESAGTLAFYDLRPGRYFAVETRAPAGYLLVSPVAIVLVGGETVRAAVVDDPVPPAFTAPPEDQTGEEGTAGSFALGSFSSPTVRGPWTVTVDWGDGQRSAYEATATGSLGLQSHTYLDDGDFAVTVTIADVHGVSASAAFMVTVANLAPVIERITNDGPVNEGASATIQATVTDAGAADVLSYAFDCDGDGTFEIAPAVPATGCSFADDGQYAVAIRATDDDGGEAIGVTTVTVVNVAPAVDAGAGGTIDEGGTLAGAGSFTDPGADIWTASIDYGDGSPAEPLTLNPDGTFAFTHVYADDGIFTLRISVSDEDGGTGSGQTTVTVLNLAPVVGEVAGPDGEIKAKDPVEIGAAFTDPGVRDVHTVTIDWGDGTTSAGTVEESGGAGLIAGTHTYPGRGIYTITVTVSDDDGAADSSTRTVEIKGPKAKDKEKKK